MRFTDLEPEIACGGAPMVVNDAAVGEGVVTVSLSDRLKVGVVHCSGSGNAIRSRPDSNGDTDALPAATRLL